MTKEELEAAQQHENEDSDSDVPELDDAGEHFGMRDGRQ